MMERKPPIALVKQDKPDEIVAWACGKCGVVAGSALSHGDHAREMAIKHCGPWLCEDCGTEHDRSYQPLCSKCWGERNAKRRAAEEEVAYQKATKLSSAEYHGPVYWDESNHNEGYFADIDELCEWCEEEELDFPDYVWACTVWHPSIDSEDVREMALSDFAEGVELDADEELEAFFKAWNAKQTGETWEVDHHRAVVLASVCNNQQSQS